MITLIQCCQCSLLLMIKFIFKKKKLKLKYLLEEHVGRRHGFWHGADVEIQTQLSLIN